MCGTWGQKRKKTTPTPPSANGAERRRTAASRRARNAVHGGIFAATAADTSRFTVLWASQGEFDNHLLHSGHPRANSLAIYGTLGISGRIRSRFTAFWAFQSEFARYLLRSGHPRASSLAVRGLPKPRFPKVSDRSRSAVLPLRRGWRSHMDMFKGC